MLLLNKNVTLFCPHTGHLILGTGIDHTPAYILIHATEGISRTLILFFLEGSDKVKIINKKCF
jgi:hypothetical protein